jgi:hypothetical protein
MFIVYFDYMLSIVSLSLCLCIGLYSIHSNKVPWMGGRDHVSMVVICYYLRIHSCHTRFSKEQNQTNHMCAQEVHTYARMKKYKKQCYYITYA